MFTVYFFVVLILVFIGTLLLQVSDNRYEAKAIASCLSPKDLCVDFQEMVGCDILLKDAAFVMKGFKNPPKNLLFSPPSGILLYGPPGTGKTMFAKALAKKCGFTFITMSPQYVESKYHGESNKYMDAFFKVAKKNSPCILFIDEMDGLLSERSSLDPSHVNSLKTTFLQLADGVRDKGRVLLLGATNRLDHLDKAVLRRFPMKFKMSLPELKDRESMFRRVLKNENVVRDMDYETLSICSEGYSYSDIYEYIKHCGKNKFMKGNHKRPWTFDELNVFSHYNEHRVTSGIHDG